MRMCLAREIAMGLHILQTINSMKNTLTRIRPKNNRATAANQNILITITNLDISITIKFVLCNSDQSLCKFIQFTRPFFFFKQNAVIIAL